MRYLLSVYRRHLPIQTADTAIQNIIQCYLMIAELETELNRTWFYKVFPTLQYPGNGTNLRSIRDILNEVTDCPSLEIVIFCEES